jgi:hypothetical protein
MLGLISAKAPDWRWERSIPHHFTLLPIWFSPAGIKMVRDVTDPAAAGQPPARFHRNPPGRGQLAVFPSGGCRTRFLRIDLDMLVARALKNSQLTCGERHAISRTGH